MVEKQSVHEDADIITAYLISEPISPYYFWIDYMNNLKKKGFMMRQYILTMMMISSNWLMPNIGRAYRLGHYIPRAYFVKLRFLERR